MTARDRVLLTVIAVLALLGGLWWFVVKPARADLAANRAQLQSVQEQSDVVRDQIARLERAEGGEVAQSLEGFRLAKAVPARVDVPAVLVQLQRIADDSNVQLRTLRTNGTTDYGGFRATELEVIVAGRFFDVDDFMFRMHRMVTVDEGDRPRVRGRLIAVRGFEMRIAEEGEVDPDAPRGRDRVETNLRLLVFSSPESGAAIAGPSPGVPAPGSAPAPAPAAAAPPA
ncbi:MAG TPA: type II secretion system protein GspM, partial [Miltoncostaeaceae bacterium]|nr:type II secretion system protein GspM [Miltoncostaeaceae bacterium]